MLKKMLKNKTQIAFLILLVGMLACIRFFESTLFYDPFLSFFKTDFQNKSLPDYNSTQLFVNIFFRYSLNSIISLVILYVLFKDKNILKLSIGLYVVFLVVLLVLFAIELNLSTDYTLLFYTRRFLIQPMFLILLIPAFYYQKINK